MTMTMTEQLVRIALRYLSGALVAGGAISAGAGDQIATDPVLTEYLVAGVGLAIGAATEWWFSKSARRTT